MHTYTHLLSQLLKILFINIYIQLNQDMEECQSNPSEIAFLIMQRIPDPWSTYSNYCCFCCVLVSPTVSPGSQTDLNDLHQ